MKKVVTIECPCGEYEYTLSYVSKDKNAEKDTYCPFCSVAIRDTNEDFVEKVEESDEEDE